MPRDPLAHDPPDPDDDDELDDDEDDGYDEGDEDDDDDEPEDAARASGSASAAPATPAPEAVAADTRPRWLPLNDPAVVSLYVQRRTRAPDPSRLNTLRLDRPFPVPLRLHVLRLMGSGVYTVSQRNAGGKYLGSRTVRLMLPPGNGADHANGADEFGAGMPATPATPPLAGGTDWKVAAITAAGGLLAAIVSALTQRVNAPPPPPPANPVHELKELLALLQVSNGERADAFKSGLDVARAYLEQQPPRGEGGNGTDWGQVATAVVEVLRASRPAAGPAAPAVGAPGVSAAVPAAVPAPAVAASRAQLLEQAIVFEIERALQAGDGPDTLVEILEAWLGDAELAYLTANDEAAVLGELPRRFAAHADYLARPPVQQFLRSALAMLREDQLAGELRAAEGPDAVPSGLDTAEVAAG